MWPLTFAVIAAALLSSVTAVMAAPLATTTAGARVRLSKALADHIADAHVARGSNSDLTALLPDVPNERWERLSATVSGNALVRADASQRAWIAATVALLDDLPGETPTYSRIKGSVDAIETEARVALLAKATSFGDAIAPIMSARTWVQRSLAGMWLKGLWRIGLTTARPVLERLGLSATAFTVLGVIVMALVGGLEIGVTAGSPTLSEYADGYIGRGAGTGALLGVLVGCGEVWRRAIVRLGTGTIGMSSSADGYGGRGKLLGSALFTIAGLAAVPLVRGMFLNVSATLDSAGSGPSITAQPPTQPSAGTEVIPTVGSSIAVALAMVFVGAMAAIWTHRGSKTLAGRWAGRLATLACFALALVAILGPVDTALTPLLRKVLAVAALACLLLVPVVPLLVNVVGPLMQRHRPRGKREPLTRSGVRTIWSVGFLLCYFVTYMTAFVIAILLVPEAPTSFWLLGSVVVLPAVVFAPPAYMGYRRHLYRNEVRRGPITAATVHPPPDALPATNPDSSTTG